MDHVLVIGASSLDVKGQSQSAPVHATSIPGNIRNSIGGTGRNIAENLARLEVETRLITAVGDDFIGEWVLGHAAAVGIDVSHSVVLPGGRTGCYMALLEEHGVLDYAMYDMDVMHAITPEYLDQHVDLFKQAQMVVIDANLPPDSIQTVMWLCTEYEVPLCADPTSTTLASRLKPYLANFTMISPNVPETAVLCDCSFETSDRDAGQAAARKLVVEGGVELAVVTLSEFGVVYASEETSGRIPALRTQVVDETGAGDAQTAAIIFGLLQEIPLDESVRLGVTAASLTMRTRESVRPDLTVELLYDELAI
ncbi:MAG: ribokinase [Chloroflexi bacterium]|nr:ribokinase [Chloroflexota bacterium]